jgi:hypothetical protein
MMIRILLTFALALFSLSCVVYALAASGSQRPIEIPQVGVTPLPLPAPTEAMPPPQEPFDETPITPVESAGAPMRP